MERLRELVKEICDGHQQVYEFFAYPECVLKLSTCAFHIDNVSFTWFGDENWKIAENFITITSLDTSWYPHYYINVNTFAIYYWNQSSEYGQEKVYIDAFYDLSGYRQLYLMEKLEQLLIIIYDLIKSVYVTRLTK